MSPTRLAAALLVVFFVGCERQTPIALAPDEAAELRIVTLAPHLTELVFSAGAGEQLVGVVEYSDYPERARTLPRIGDAFAVDFERLAQLSPTLVLAWEGGNPRAVIDAVRARGYRVEALAAGSLNDVADNLRRIGAWSGRSTVAEAAAGKFEQALSQLSSRYANARTLRVFFQISAQPVYTIGGSHAISEVLSICGGRNVFSALEALAATVTDEAVVAADAQVMLTVGERTALDRWRRFDGRAVRADTLYGISADTITRDSLRVLEGAHEVCAALADARDRLPPTAH